MDIQSQVIDILADLLGVEKEKVKPKSKLVDDLGADSLDTVEINHVLEDKFNINIPDEEVVNIKTVQDLTDYLKSKINK